MTATFRQAQQDMMALVNQVGVNHSVKMVYENTKDYAPTGNAPWAKVEIRHLDGGQASLANHAGIRRWRRSGVLWIQLRVPIGGGLAQGYELGQYFVDAIQKTSTDHCVWFRNVRLNEVGPDGAWYQMNVLANFEYDQVV